MPTFNALPAVLPTENAINFLAKDAPVNPDFSGGGTITSGTGNGLHAGILGAPTGYFRLLVGKDGTGGDTLKITGPDANKFDVHSNSFLVGKKARVQRIVNGALIDVRESEIIEAHTYSFNAIEPNYLFTTTTVEFSVHAFHPRDIPITYTVAAVGSDNKWGALATYQQQQIVSNPASEAVVNTKEIRVGMTSGGSLPAPGNFTVSEKSAGSQVHRVTFDPVPGAEGYVVFYSPRATTEVTDDPRLVLAPDPANPLQTDDIAFLSGLILEQSEADGGTFWGVSPEVDDYMPPSIENRLGEDPNKAKPVWVPFAGDKPDPLLPDHYIRLSATAGQSIRMQTFYSSGTLQPFYSHLVPGEAWKFEIWARASIPLTIPFQNFHPHVGNDTLNIGTTWQKHEITFAATDVAEATGAYSWLIAHLATEAVDLDVIGMRCYNTRLPYGWPTARISEHTHLRTHTPIKIGPVDMTMTAYLSDAGNVFRGESLRLLLEFCKSAKLTPHLQIEPIYGKADWENLAAYLSAPVSSGHPMALRRQEHGQVEPWTEVFDQIIFEIGNEIWNTTKDFLVMPPVRDQGTGVLLTGMTAAGILMERIAQWIKATPYWSNLAPVLDFFCGGWANQPQYTEDLLRAFKSCTMVGIAAYTSGWDVNSIILEDKIAVAQNLLAVIANHGHTMRNHKDVVDRVNAERALEGIPPARQTCYEAGPGYQIPGLNGAVVTPRDELTEAIIQATRYAACANIDSALYMGSLGFEAFNYFTLGPGAGYISRSQDGDGGREFTPYNFWCDFIDEMGVMKCYSANLFKNDVRAGINSNGQPFEIETMGLYMVQSITTPGRWAAVAVNRRVNKTVWPATDPDYDANDTGVQSALFGTGFTNFTQCRRIALEGNCREHNRHRDGTRLTSPTNNRVYAREADPLCVDTSSTVTDVTAELLANPGRIPVENLLGGNAVIYVFDGVEFDGEVIDPDPVDPFQDLIDSGAVLMSLDMTSVWQDEAGTVAGVVGSDVARVDDVAGADNHSIQAVAASRPILRDSPRHLDIDAAGDAIAIPAPVEGWTGAMVFGTEWGVATYGVAFDGPTDIGASYAPGKDVIGLLVADRALTTTESAAVHAEFEAAGAPADFSAVTNIVNAWRDWTWLTEMPAVDLSNVTNGSEAWNGCTNLVSVGDMATSSLTSATRMFRGCQSLTQVPDFDFSGVALMIEVFFDCQSLTNLPALDMSSASWFSGTFYQNLAMTSFPLCDMSNGQIFTGCWQNCRNMATIAQIDTSSGTHFDSAWRQCEVLNPFPALNFESATTFRFAWLNCLALTTFPPNVFDSCAATNFEAAFQGTNLSQASIDGILVSLDTAGQSNGNFGQSGGSAPSATGEAAITSLRTKGWTVAVQGGF